MGVLRGVYRERAGFAAETIKIIDSRGRLRWKLEIGPDESPERVFRWLTHVLDAIDPLPSIKMVD